MATFVLHGDDGLVPLPTQKPRTAFLAGHFLPREAPEPVAAAIKELGGS